MGGTFLKGPLGWARRAVVPTGHRSAATTVAAWFMHLPGQGIGWDEFLLSVISLEDTSGMPAAHQRYPGAEFELTVSALDPDLGPRVDDVETWLPMVPVNFVGQFHGVGRDGAARIAEALAAGCVTGRLVAETQIYVQMYDGPPAKMMAVQQLLDAWTDALAQCVEHERTGGLHASAN
jgi:hypothetical protein